MVVFVHKSHKLAITAFHGKIRSYSLYCLRIPNLGNNSTVSMRDNKASRGKLISFQLTVDELEFRISENC